MVVINRHFKAIISIFKYEGHYGISKSIDTCHNNFKMTNFNMKFTQGHLTETMAYFIDLEESVNMFNTDN